MRLPIRSSPPGGGRALRALLLLAALALPGCRQAPEGGAGGPFPTAPPPREPEPAPAGRPVSAGEPAAVAAARAALGTPVVAEACGPYQLLTDAAGPLLGGLRALCAGPVTAFESEYRHRFGVAPSEPPAGTLVLFAERRRFQRYVAADPRLPRVAAGFSLALDGLVALPAGERPLAEVAGTLIHELAHLAHRRTFGSPLEPWLSEGLADELGYSAGPDGFASPAGFTGMEGLRTRLRGGYATGRAGPLARLVALPRSSFDRDPVSWDYDQAALFVRFLLLDPELAPRFRAWLAARAAGGTPPPLTAGLGLDEEALESRFRRWLDGPARGGS